MHVQPPDLIRVSAMTAAGERVELPGQEVGTSSDEVLRQTAHNATNAMQFFRDRFGHVGIDGRGSPAEIVVHAQDEERPQRGLSNAFFDEVDGRIYFGDGDGKMMRPFGLDPDIVVHELAHGIVAHTSRLGSDPEARALNESFSDVMASAMSGDWKQAETLFIPHPFIEPGSECLRDLERPDGPTMMPAGRIEVDGMNVYDLSQIASLAAVRAAATIGIESLGAIWFDAFTTRLTPQATFQDARAATVAAAVERHGSGSGQAHAVGQAWESVGVLTPSTTSRDTMQA